MIVVLREAGLRIVIYVDDHPPPHVHVIGDGEARIRLVGPDGRPQVMEVDGMKVGDLRKALAAIENAQAMLLGEWSRIHG
ncbi:MAG: DUF4160 domain-containing protein [Devosia sp.]